MSNTVLKINSETLEVLYQILPVYLYRFESRCKLLLQYEQTLHQLEHQAAQHGPLEVPVGLSNQINKIRSIIEEVEIEIEQLEGLISQTKGKIEEKQDNVPPISRPQHRFRTFMEWPPFDQYAKDCCEIFVAGGSLDNLTQLYGPFLVGKAESGCDVKLVLMNHESKAISSVEIWSSPGIPEDYYRRAICRTLRHLSKLTRGRKFVGTFEVRLDPSIPALAVMILDGSKDSGRIRVDIQPFQAVAVERPVFELTRQGEDIKWFNMFYHQYAEKLWEIAKPVDLSNLPPEYS